MAKRRAGSLTCWTLVAGDQSGVSAEGMRANKKFAQLARSAALIFQQAQNRKVCLQCALFAAQEKHQLNYTAGQQSEKLSTIEFGIFICGTARQSAPAEIDPSFLLRENERQEREPER